MLDLDVENSLPKHPSEFPQSVDIDFGEVPLFEFSGDENKDFREARSFFSIFSTEVLNKEPAYA